MIFSTLDPSLSVLEDHGGRMARFAWLKPLDVLDGAVAIAIDKRARFWLKLPCQRLLHENADLEYRPRDVRLWTWTCHEDVLPLRIERERAGQRIFCPKCNIGNCHYPRIPFTIIVILNLLVALNF